VKLQFLSIWIDECARDGPEAMAVDEWLVDCCETAILRIYRWHGNWGSLGCFGRLSDAQQALPDLDWVRRWTGGGAVDHRDDWTYSLFLPAGHPIADLRGADSYRVIHHALQGALADEGHVCKMEAEPSVSAGGVCFQKTAQFDLADCWGRKIAGAGQRRGRRGLLHQGSVAIRPQDMQVSRARACLLASGLAADFTETSMDPAPDEIARLCRERYRCMEWTARR
jgi:lipoate-protein ligase A